MPRRSRRTRVRASASSILDAVLPLLAREHDGASMRMAAGAAGTSVGALYLHFTSKEDLLRSAAVALMDRLSTLLSEATTEPTARRAFDAAWVAAGELRRRVGPGTDSFLSRFGPRAPRSARARLRAAFHAFQQRLAQELPRVDVVRIAAAFGVWLEAGEVDQPSARDLAWSLVSPPEETGLARRPAEAYFADGRVRQRTDESGD